jgi:hypothetical protein
LHIIMTENYWGWYVPKVLPVTFKTNEFNSMHGNPLTAQF